MNGILETIIKSGVRSAVERQTQTDFITIASVVYINSSPRTLQLSDLVPAFPDVHTLELMHDTFCTFEAVCGAYAAKLMDAEACCFNELRQDRIAERNLRAKRMFVCDVTHVNQFSIIILIYYTRAQ